MRLISGYYVGAEAAGQIIQAMWAQIGVPLELEFVESMKQALEPGADVRMISAAFRFPDPLGGGVVPAWGPDSAVQKRGFWSSDRFQRRDRRTSGGAGNRRPPADLPASARPFRRRGAGGGALWA